MNYATLGRRLRNGPLHGPPVWVSRHCALPCGWMVAAFALTVLFAGGRALASDRGDQVLPGSGVLEVVITGFPNDSGRARIMLSDRPSGWPRHTPAVRAADLVIRAGRTVWRVADLPFGEYTIRFYHDANRNNEFDTGVLGLPKERYGFSNNARVWFGPPSYKRARFQFDHSPMRTHLVVQ